MNENTVSNSIDSLAAAYTNRSIALAVILIVGFLMLPILDIEVSVTVKLGDPAQEVASE